MIGTWRVVSLEREPLVKISLGARVGGHQLLVQRCGGEDCWHWVVQGSLGREIEGGTAPDARSAELMAEEAAFHIHPPSVGGRVPRLGVTATVRP
jgi:hypothetical protein